jgi:hypothetical protein
MIASELRQGRAEESQEEMTIARVHGVGIRSSARRDWDSVIFLAVGPELAELVANLL